MPQCETNAHSIHSREDGALDRITWRLFDAQSDEDSKTTMETAEQATEIARDFDLKTIGQDFLDDPYPIYRALREHDPVHVCPDGSVFLTRHRDCDAVYRDRRFSSDKTVEFRPKFGDSPLFTHHTTSLVSPTRHVTRASAAS